MRCPRCGSGDIHFYPVTRTWTKHRGCIGWFFWILLCLCTCFLILIIPAITNSKTRSKTYTEAVCQSCGKRWRA